MSDPQTHAIIGAAMEVHREMGHGFLEAVYQASLSLELRDREIPYNSEVSLPIHYKKKQLTCSYRADFICYQDVIVETKATSGLTKADYSQILNQLKATGFRRGLLLNFGTTSLQYKRLVLGPDPDADIDLQA